MGKCCVKAEMQEEHRRMAKMASSEEKIKIGTRRPAGACGGNKFLACVSVYNNSSDGSSACHRSIFHKTLPQTVVLAQRSVDQSLG